MFMQRIRHSLKLSYASLGLDVLGWNFISVMTIGKGQQGYCSLIKRF